MKIEQIRQALEVYRTGSINKAARNLFIVQSTLSTSIRSLEKELGQDIFIRKQNGIEVTEFGKEFFRLGQEMLDIYDQIQQMATKKAVMRKRRNSVFLYIIWILQSENSSIFIPSIRT